MAAPSEIITANTMATTVKVLLGLSGRTAGALLAVVGAGVASAVGALSDGAVSAVGELLACGTRKPPCR